MSQIFTIHKPRKCEICEKPVKVIHGISHCGECGFVDDNF